MVGKLYIKHTIMEKELRENMYIQSSAQLPSHIYDTDTFD